MSHNILSLMEDQFDTRIILGPCLININGETVEVEITKDSSINRNPTYTVTKKGTSTVLCTFRPYHLHTVNSLGTMYQIEQASAHGGDATLFVPLVDPLFKQQDDEFDEEY